MLEDGEENESEADRLALVRGLGGKTFSLDGADVLAIFIDAHTPVAFGDHVIDSSDPQIVGRTSDLSSATSSSVIKRGDAAYGVAAIEPDGTGMTTIRLREL